MCPIHGQGPLLVAQPVADVVHISCIDQHLQTGTQQVRKFVLVVFHPVMLECQIHNSVAAAPLFVDAKLRLGLLVIQEALDFAEVIAKRRFFALDAHVIGVVPGELVWDQLTIVAEGIGRSAGVGGVRTAGIAGGNLLDTWDGGSLHGKCSDAANDTCASN